MTAPHPEPLAILTDSDGHPAYGVPLAVLAAHQATPDQRAAFDARMSDMDGFRLAPDQPLYLPPVEALEPYHLSDEQRAAMLSPEAGSVTTDDVEGHSWPGWGYPTGSPGQANGPTLGGHRIPDQSIYTMNRYDPEFRSRLMAVYPR